MRRNLLVKGKWSLLGRKTACVKVQKILVYSSTTFEDFRKGAVSRAKEKRAREEDVFRRQSGRGAKLGRLRMTLMPAFFHCLSASP